MKINNPTLEKIAVLKEQYPSPTIPEIALAGRSNVGKSSLINTIMNRKNLARTSSQPGKTRTINFYNIDGVFRLVDLPGYGYAQASKEKREEWAGYINTYLENRENLKEIFLIVDFRHEPTALDLMMYDYIIECGYTGIVVATKTDKVKTSQYQKNLKSILNKLGIKNKDLVIPFSSEARSNRDLLLNTMVELIK